MFADSHKIPEWAKEHVKRVTDAGLMNGYPDGTFRPDDKISRAEMAKVLSMVILKGHDLDGVDLRDLLMKVRNNVVDVWNPDGSTGSGVIVSPTGHVLTNAHVVGDSGSCEIIWRGVYSDEQFPRYVGPTAKVVARDVENDLALLDLDWRGNDLSAIEINPGWVDNVECNKTNFGSTVFTQGSPLGWGGRIAKLTYTGHRSFKGGALLDLEGHVNSGNSGGPIFDGEGRLVGIVVAKLVDVVLEGFGLGIPLSRIMPFLRQNGLG